MTRVPCDSNEWRNYQIDLPKNLNANILCIFIYTKGGMLIESLVGNLWSLHFMFWFIMRANLSFETNLFDFTLSARGYQFQFPSKNHNISSIFRPNQMWEWNFCGVKRKKTKVASASWLLPTEWTNVTCKWIVNSRYDAMRCAKETNRNEMWKWLLNLVENNRKIAFATKEWAKNQNEKKWCAFHSLPSSLVLFAAFAFCFARFRFCSFHFVSLHRFSLTLVDFIGSWSFHKTQLRQLPLCWLHWLRYTYPRLMNMNSEHTHTHILNEHKGSRSRNKPITFHCWRKNIIMISHFRRTKRLPKHRWNSRIEKQCEEEWEEGSRRGNVEDGIKKQQQQKQLL